MAVRGRTLADAWNRHIYLPRSPPRQNGVKPVSDTTFCILMTARRHRRTQKSPQRTAQSSAESRQNAGSHRRTFCQNVVDSARAQCASIRAHYESDSPHRSIQPIRSPEISFDERAMNSNSKAPSVSIAFPDLHVDVAVHLYGTHAVHAARHTCTM